MTARVASSDAKDCYQLHNLTLLRDDSSDLLKIPVSSMPCGKFICITGPSGAGKSSLLLAMAGLNFKYTGMISYCADEPNVCTPATRSKSNAPDAPRKFTAYPLSTMTDKQLTRFRQQNIGFIFQQYRLINELSVLANAALSANWIEKKQRSSIEVRAASLLDELAINGTNKLCLSCSGGERQRIAAARALASNPHVLLADEPTASLDAANRDLLLDVMIDATINKNKTLIACSHDEAMIERADHVWHLDGGVLEPVR